ncbi:UNVERIFIED_ORG: hypothetical protein J2W38_007329 [Variovorax paradoxus]|nr:hypothetical protein [Variovorax paradoxus]
MRKASGFDPMAELEDDIVGAVVIAGELAVPAFEEDSLACRPG